MAAPIKKPNKDKVKKEQTEQEKRPFEERHNCLICGKPGPETICEHCKITVQAEALAEKRKIEKGGRG
jgi:hypothetical protein